MTIEREAFYDVDYVMDMSKNFNFAVAFTAYDNERENILDPSIGELVFKANQWGYDEDLEVYEETITLKSHTCSMEELGLTDSGSKARKFLP